MKKLSFTLIIMTLIVSSVILIVNYQTDQGLLNNSNRNHMNTIDSKDKLKNTNKKASKEVSNITSKEKREKHADSKKKTPKKIVITIDPGHQKKANIGQEPIAPGSNITKYKATVGSIGVVSRKPEYAITLNASRLLQKKLQQKGYKVVLTRNTNNIDLSNRDRAKIANQHKSALYIRVHADGAENTNAHGFSIIAPSKNNPYTKKVFIESQKASKTIVEQIGKDFTLYQSGLSYRDDLSGFNWSKVPVILVELGYVTNPQEDKNLTNKKYLEKLSTSIAQGVDQYFDKK